MPRVRANGVRFNVEAAGSGDPLIVLHGFTGSAKSWSPIVASLSGSFHTIAVDLIGHGDSDAPADVARYGFALVLDDLAEIATRLGIQRASWLGYSMGGRLALGLALRHPERVSALVLESTSPGIADPAERAQRRQTDEALARSIDERGVAAFVDDWERLPLWRSQAQLPAEVLRRQRAIRLCNRATGLAGSLRGMGSGAQPSFWPRLAEMQAPTLLLAGALDAKYADIATRMASAIPNAELMLVPNTGHAVHLEQPAIFAEAVSRFLSHKREIVTQT
jgi:2-succinyl-6-hydroxy-2,4-cyclohexadiene-1-carboxylate synthase